MDGVIYNTSVFFNNVYSAEWLEDPFAQKIIKAVDRGVVLGPNAIETKVLGVIPPEKLSSGTKTLLLMHFMPENIYNASNCGDNCARWILAIGKAQDVTVNLYHLMNFGERRFTIRFSPFFLTISTLPVSPDRIAKSGGFPANPKRCENGRNNRLYPIWR